MAQGSGQFSIAWQRDPALGAKAVTVKLTFTGAGSQAFDLLAEMAQRWIDVLKAVFIDNGAGSTAFVLTLNTGMKISCPANTQGIFPIIMGLGDAQFIATAGGAGTVTLIFLNEDVAYTTWKGN